MSHLSLAAPALVIVAAILLWLFAGWLCFANWQRSPNRRASGWLEMFRFVLITLLGLTLLRPEFVKRLEQSSMPEIAVLTDSSGSMNTRDVEAGSNVISREQWIQNQVRRKFWHSLDSKAKVSVEPFSAPSTNANAVNGTDLNLALEETLHRYKNLKAVLLLSDGDWNLGKSPLGTATQYREQNIPIFTVAVGRETPVPDLILENVSAPSYGLFGEEIAVAFKVTSHLAREVRTSLSISDNFGESAKKEITVPANGDVEDSILWSPRETGEITATVKLPVEPDEAIAENNERTFHMSVRVEKLKVLVVDSLPRWEYRYLRNALARDPGVDMRCLLLHPGMGPGDGLDYIHSFPDSKEALSPYDVVFLGDVGIGENELTDKDAELLKGLVEQQGSGLVFVPGRRGREVTFLNSPLKDLYPVDLDTSKPNGVGLENEAQLVLTSEGRRHWLTRFDSDEERNDELWKQLPGFFWSAAVEKSRPGSEVLAVHSALRNEWGRMPLLVTRTAGSGKVLFLGTDSAWRWRRGVEDKFHYRFWGQVVRWMAHQRHLSGKEGIRLSYSPETPEAGDTVFLQGTVLDESGFPIDKGPVTGKITSPGGQEERLDFTQVEGGWGVFKSSFAAQETGKYKIEIASEPYNRHLTTELLVAKPIIEKEGQPINAQTLAEISELTRGANISTGDLDKMVQQISLLPEPKPVEERIRVWSEPAWGGIILSLLTIYWVGRKWAGLI
ncbi:MAG TPA: hypothetical protein VH595_05665 [Verrucomicrobiae bacterium]|jgi:hypothetical protein|nr:hypothetical protein [Verrucomicrobiae bacterium]